LSFPETVVDSGSGNRGLPDGDADLIESANDISGCE
jgi:hypothetical protein